jgi:hypothetical protein
VATFHTDLTELDECTALEKKCSRLHLLAWLSGLRDRLNFSPNTTIEAVHLRQASINEHAALVYRVHISNMSSVSSILAHEGQPIGP